VSTKVPARKRFHANLFVGSEMKAGLPCARLPGSREFAPSSERERAQRCKSRSYAPKLLRTERPRKMKALSS
jgi:hypothetical protein